jgi:hypothetical protein
VSLALADEARGYLLDAADVLHPEYVCPPPEPDKDGLEL